MDADNIVVLENSLRYLRRCLAFPKKEDVNNPGLSFYLKFLALTLSTIMFFIGNLLHVLVNLKRKNYINLDLDLALSASQIGSYYFNFSYLRQVKNTIKIYKQLSDLNTYGMPDNFNEKNKKLNYLSSWHYVYIICVMVGMSAAPLFEYQKCKRENVEKNIHEICGLIGNIWLPIDMDRTPYKQLYYVFQVYSCFVIYQTSSLISFSILETIEHLILRLRHVRTVFLQALAEKEYNISREKFRNAVEYHVKVIGIADMVNASFKMCMFGHILLTGAILGCVEYRLLKSYSLTASGLFVGWMASMSMVCIGGQRLHEESLSIGDAIYYKSKWYELNKELQRDLVIVILRCQKPLVLSAGPFGYMTYATILALLKTSYSYLTILNQNVK